MARTPLRKGLQRRTSTCTTLSRPPAQRPTSVCTTSGLLLVLRMPRALALRLLLQEFLHRFSLVSASQVPCSTPPVLVSQSAAYQGSVRSDAGKFIDAVSPLQGSCFWCRKQDVDPCPTYQSHGADDICQPHGVEVGHHPEIRSFRNVNRAPMPVHSLAYRSGSTPTGPCSLEGSGREPRPISRVRRSIPVPPTATHEFSTDHFVPV